MDAESGDLPKLTSIRHKCPACFKQYNKKEHLVQHVKFSNHSRHQPKCPVCKKHCKSLESVREHLTGLLSKDSCANAFIDQGCSLCLDIFDTSYARNAHEELCRLSPACPECPLLEKSMSQPEIFDSTVTRITDCCREVVAIDCEMVGGGSDGSLDLCARVCMIDENEKVIFHSFVKPQLPITDYRSEITGLTEKTYLAEATPLAQVKHTIEKILYNGECISRARLSGGQAKILVGHGLDRDLDCLKIDYPRHLLRDTSIYSPLMKTNFVSHSLKYLTKTYLGYEIQAGIHDPYEDSVAALRIYKRMRDQPHEMESGYMLDSRYNSDNYNIENAFFTLSSKSLEEKSPDALLEMFGLNYRCWCVDTKGDHELNGENNGVGIDDSVQTMVDEWPAW